MSDWRYEVWVDFNDIDNEGNATTLQAFANQTLFVGDRVVAKDGDGCRSPGVVKSTADGALVIHLEGESSLLPCAYCGADEDEPCRAACQGRYRP